jgi:hypothetical protein
MTTIRVNIQGTWSAQDFAEYFSALNHIYSILAITEIERDSAQDFEHYIEEFDFMFHKMMRSSRRFRHWLAFQRSTAPGLHRLLDASNVSGSFEVLEGSERLHVKRLEFASPGHTDLSGLGTAMGHVKDIVIKLIDVCVGRKERNINNNILEEDHKAAVMRNLREQISILKELGYSEAEIRTIVASANPAIEKLIQLTNRGLITAVTERANDGEG